MASPASPEASDIRRRGRQRLIGAIAIAVLLVVFVPMVLDSEPRSAREAPALEIPPKQNAPALPPPTPPTPDPAKAPAVEPAKSPAEAPKVAKAEPQKAPAAEQPKAAAEPPKKADVPPKAVAPKLEGFAVQVGAFKDEDKLKLARDKLAAARVAHYIERIDSPAGPLTRLRAGPYPTREAADKALASMKASALDGKVVPLP
jgi:DedD protein